MTNPGAQGGAPAVTVADAPQARRYEAMAGDDLAGTAAYIRTPEVIAFIHTEVGDAYEGRGIGSALARTALDDARAQGLRVLAICPFIAGWMSRHPEYDDLQFVPESKVSD
ncbi:GNAT family N-acetyltransferase [Actinacidiphila bryophytorum]|uniref:GNAT family N-acetyltransferase n=1 Tax=Actinacidiphila bryophytorum TaxID=1436133 RepID=UPI002AFE5B10|nr:GNAT family N-acetyltransferase [Actinacidiphila bryophytorum]